MWQNQLTEVLRERRDLTDVQEYADFTNGFLNSNKDKKEGNSSANNVTDGKWVVLQDWSQCTLACGGGRQFLQRTCMPPRNGGKNCDGPTILEKVCNAQECPTESELLLKGSDREMEPRVKLMNFTNHPLRFEVIYD